MIRLATGAVKIESIAVYVGTQRIQHVVIPMTRVEECLCYN